IVGNHLVQGQLHGRILPREGANRSGYEVIGAGRSETHPQKAGVTTLCRSQDTGRFIPASQQWFYMGQQYLSCVSKLHMALIAMKKRRAKRLLKPANLLGQGWLRNMHSGCRTTKVQFFRYCNEVSKMTQFHSDPESIDIKFDLIIVQ